MEQLRVTDDGVQRRKLLDSLFRSVHNLKARASADGLTKLVAAAHEFEDVLHTLRQHAVEQAVGAGARLFLIQTDLDVSDFDRQFQNLKQTLNKTGEVISTEPSASKERPGTVNFRIVYAATQVPAELPPGITVAEISTPARSHTFAQEFSDLECAFGKFAAELINPDSISFAELVERTVRGGKAMGELIGKDIEFELKGDAALLSRLPGDRLAFPFIHLIRNAVDHGIEKRGKVTIEIASHDDLVLLTVTDDGRGIDPSLISRIFEPGFSTAGKISESSGRGVGLDAVKTSVEELGGTVNVRSAPGQGTSFELTLPIHSA